MSSKSPQGPFLVERRQSARVLGELGIPMVDERIYRALLQSQGLTASDVACALQVRMRTAQRALWSLERNALVIDSLEFPPRYTAVPPGLAIEALMAKRHAKARATIEELERTATRSKSAYSEQKLVQIITHEATAQIFSHILDSAKHEVLGMVRTPVFLADGEQQYDLQIALLSRGVKFRTIADSSSLVVPGLLSRIRAAANAGELYRFQPTLPLKLVVVDRRVAIFPLDLTRQDGQCALIRSSLLLDALCEMFEMLWRSASPFSLDSANPQKLSMAQQGNEGEVDAMLPLLVSGLNDKTIEIELGISKRTLTRRIVALMRQLGAATRFQAGWLAAQAAREISQRDSV